MSLVKPLIDMQCDQIFAMHKKETEKKRNKRKKQNAKMLKAYNKAKAKREIARKHDGLNIWQVGFAYSVLGILGGACLFITFYSFLSMGA